jgi:hypothetical protein
MQIHQSDRPDPEILFEFAKDFQEAYESCERMLIALEHQPNNAVLTEDFLRSIQFIQDNFTYVGYSELCPLLESVNAIVNAVTNHELEFDDMLSDVLLLSIEAVHSVVEENVSGGESLISKDQFKMICRSVRAIANNPRARKPAAVQQALAILDPALLDPDSHTDAADPLSSLMHGLSERTGEINHHYEEFGVSNSADLDFMALLAPALEHRSPFWHGRTERIATMCLTLNECAERPVDPSQLLAAVYMHDVAMSFLPLSLLHKDGNYVQADRDLVREHVELAYQLLHMNPGRWTIAENIVLQHHERCNGGGYPLGLLEDDICDGAKILAIADAFDACKHGRAYHKELNRPLLRVVLEVNRHAGTQFSRYWVDVFNKVVDKDSLLH